MPIFTATALNVNLASRRIALNLFPIARRSGMRPVPLQGLHFTVAIRYPDSQLPCQPAVKQRCELTGVTSRSDQGQHVRPS
jgi:hypothetical protein